MKIEVTKRGDKDVAVSFEAENQAEKLQVDALAFQLDKATADWGPWHGMDGAKGITIIGNLKPNPDECLHKIER